MAWVQGEEGFGRGDVVQAVPFEEDRAGGDIEFWEELETGMGESGVDGDVPWKMASTIHCCSALPPQADRSRGTGW